MPPLQQGIAIDEMALCDHCAQQQFERPTCGNGDFPPIQRGFAMSGYPLKRRRVRHGKTAPLALPNLPRDYHPPH
jgi:hypothetical protein